MYYGQFNPPVDWLIERFFPLGFVGRCVEVGAVDGLHLSNTLHFEEIGWPCLCIEPNTYYHEALRRNRKLFLPYAVSDRDQSGVPLFRVRIGNTFDACTGLQPDPQLMMAFSNVINLRDQILVETRTLDSCLQEVAWPNVDFVTIDTEGTELDVLKGFDLERWKPRLLVIENNFEVSAATEYLRSRGYQKAIRVEVNDFYIRVL